MKFFLKLIVTGFLCMGLNTFNVHAKLFSNAEKQAAAWILQQCYPTEIAKDKINFYANIGKVASIGVQAVGAATLLLLIGKNLSNKQQPSTIRDHGTKVFLLSLLLMGVGDFGCGVCSRLAKENKSIDEQIGSVGKQVVEKIRNKF
jgi:hypothetical protein